MLSKLFSSQLLMEIPGKLTLSKANFEETFKSKYVNQQHYKIYQHIKSHAIL